MRLDVYLAENKMTRSRSESRDYILRGKVIVSGEIIKKLAYSVKDLDKIEIKDYKNLVARSGEKLLYAIEHFNINVTDKNCIDVGSSTGGFTQVLLERGAEHITAVDVGTEQFDKKLLEKYKNKIDLHEKTDIRDFTEREFIESEKKSFDIVVCDVSFISIENIFASLISLALGKSNAIFLILIKPQFEVGRETNKTGVVTDEKLFENIKTKYTEMFNSAGLIVVDILDSPIQGGDGNREFILYAKK